MIIIELPVLCRCSTIQLFENPDDEKSVINTLIDDDNFIKLNKHRWLVIRDTADGSPHAARYVMEDGRLGLVYMANEVRRLAGLSRFKNAKKKKKDKNKIKQKDKRRQRGR